MATGENAIAEAGVKEGQQAGKAADKAEDAAKAAGKASQTAGGLVDASKAETLANDAAKGATNTGSISVANGAIPDVNERRAGKELASLGYDVTHQATASSLGISHVRTADLSVRGIGQVDVYTPKIGTSMKAITRAIEKKADQATGILVQADLSSSEMASIAERTWGKPDAQSIQTLFSKNQMEPLYVLTDQYQESNNAKVCM